MRRATVVLPSRPGQEQGEAIAEALVDLYGALVDRYVWEIRDTLPTGLAVSQADQLGATARDFGAGACYLVVKMYEAVKA